MKLRAVFIQAGLAAVLCFTTLVEAGPTLVAEGAGKSPMDQAIESVRTTVASQTSDGAVVSPKEKMPSAIPESPSDLVIGDAATKQKYLDAMKRFYEYRADGYAYRSRVFEWQLFSSKLIFTVVLFLVLAGVYFAAVQFHMAMRVIRRDRAASTAAAAEVTAGANELASELEISSKGIAIKSSVLGVIVLALSLVFYYLYLVYVYPIQNVI